VGISRLLKEKRKKITIKDQGKKSTSLTSLHFKLLNSGVEAKFRSSVAAETARIVASPLSQMRLPQSQVLATPSLAFGHCATSPGLCFRLLNKSTVPRFWRLYLLHLRLKMFQFYCEAGFYLRISLTSSRPESTFCNSTTARQHGSFILHKLLQTTNELV
jgi:hypothetical protein